MSNALCDRNWGIANLVVPGAGPAGVGALVAGVDVYQYAVAVPGEVGRALAVTASAVAGERDALAGEAAASEGGRITVEWRR